MHFKRQRHCVIECIPIKYGDYEEFPAYFKQSILTQADEWATNRKIIDTTTRGFRKSLVKNLPYFHVWLGVDGGYGHVIESEDGFSLTFGKEVVAGMLDLSSELWRKPRVKNHHEAESDLTAFRKIFDKYDWTKQLAQ